MTYERGLCLEEVNQDGVCIVAVKGEQRCVLSRICSEEADLTGEVRRLQEELDRLGEQGRERLAELREQERMADPAQLWQEMEALADEEQMVAYFNALSGTSRRRVAEHVMTRVSAFKGRAPSFASRYNWGTNLLE